MVVIFLSLVLILMLSLSVCRRFCWLVCSCVRCLISCNWWKSWLVSLCRC